MLDREVFLDMEPDYEEDPGRPEYWRREEEPAETAVKVYWDTKSDPDDPGYVIRILDGRYRGETYQLPGRSCDAREVAAAARQALRWDRPDIAGTARIEVEVRD